MLNADEKKSLTLLIVDDEPENIRLLGSLLKAEGYPVEFAMDGQSALGWAQSKEFDAILLDVMMPGLNGYEVCGRLKRNETTKDIPVIFLTAKTDPESLLKGFEVGAVDYVTKPFKKRELLARMETHLKIATLQKNLIEANRDLEQRVIEKTNAVFNIEKTLQNEVNESFLTSLDEHAKEWFINAACHMLLADGHLDEHEIAYLRTILTFMGDASEAQRLLNAIQQRKKEPLQRITLCRENTLEILTILLKIAIVDGNLSHSEANLFLKLAVLLGMDFDLAKNMLEWGRTQLAANKLFKKVEQQFHSTNQNYFSGPQNPLEAKKLAE